MIAGWLIAGLVLLVAGVLFFLNHLPAKVDKSQFEHCIGGFLLMKKDGGRLTFEHMKTGLRVDLIRQNEVGEGCEILMKLPAAKWDQWRESLRDELDRQLFAPQVDSQNKTNALQLTIAVPNVRAPGAGARAARALVLIFGVAGLGSDERFRVVSVGENSIRVWQPTAERWVESDSPMLKKIGQSTLRGLEEEKQSKEASGDAKRDDEV